MEPHQLHRRKPPSFLLLLDSGRVNMNANDIMDQESIRFQYVFQDI